MESKFTRCLARLYHLEGLGLSKLQGDAGGQTFAGIARAYWPALPLWEIIDRSPPAGPIGIDYLNAQAQAAAFYKTTMWMPVRGDELPEDLAFELLEFAVHTTPGKSVERLQSALNLMNNRGTRWADLVEDGRFGPATMAALNKARAAVSDAQIIKVLNGLQFMYYADNARKSEEKERYFVAFLRRL